MDFVSATLIRLADPATRTAMFDQATLEEMARAAYDADALALQGPYSAVFDRFQLGVATLGVATLEGTLRYPGGGPPAELRFQVSGLGSQPPARAEALWQGSLVARVVPTDSRIESVATRFATDDVDAAIVRDLGALPNDSAALEAARRGRLLILLRGGMAQPDLLSDAAFDAWLAEIGASSVNDLMENHRGTALPGTVRIRLSPPSGAAPSPRTLPIAAALLIRDAPLSIASLIAESKLLRERLTEGGVEVPRDRSLPAKNPFLVVWVVPLTAFDDAAWPGGGGNPADARADRRRRAGVWLGPEGIAIAGVPAP